MTNPTSTSLNAERALDILLILGEVGPEGLSLMQVSQKVGSGKSAVHRSLAALQKKGFVEAAERYGHYRLGPAIPMLARRQERLEPQIELLRPGITEFSRRTGFGVYVMVEAGVDAVCAEMVSRTSRQHFSMGIGARVPMGVAAGSLALLSILPEESAARIINANAERYISHPSLLHIDAQIVSQEVAAARQRGYAVNNGFYLPGSGGLGLPVRPRATYDSPVALSFNAPLELMTECWMDKTIAELRESIAPKA